MAPTKDDLTAILKHLTSSPTLSADQVRQLADALSPGASHDVQSIALLCLSQLVSSLDSKGGSDSDKASRIKKVFDPLVADAVAGGSDPVTLVPAVSLLAGLASLAPAGTVAILTQPLSATESSDPESKQTETEIDPLAVLLEFAELPSPLQHAFATLLSALAGTKPGRELIRDRALDWVRAAAASSGVQGDTAVLCAVALSKLGREDPVVGEAEEARLAREEESGAHEASLARQLMDHVVGPSQKRSSVASVSSITSDSTSATSTHDHAAATALLPTLEGLSVLSTRPAVRDVLASDARFLKALLALSPTPGPRGGSLPVTPRGSMASFEPMAPVETALCYGLVTILANLTAPRAVLSEQDAQIARLRRMAISGKHASSDDEDPHETPEAVRARVAALYAAGVVGSLSGLVRADSVRVKEGLSRLCCYLVEEQSFRPAFVRDGGFKVLNTVIRDLARAGAPAKSKSHTPHGQAALQAPPEAEAEAAALPACQALAKLAITTPPHLLFPVPHATTALDALSPLYLLLLHPASSLLQSFEALMALTDLASIGPEFGSRITKAEVALPDAAAEFRGAGRPGSAKVRVVDRVAEMMIHDNTLVRRAAVELVCNLCNSEVGFRYFSGDGDEGESESEGSVTPSPSPSPAPGTESAAVAGTGKKITPAARRAASRLGVLLLLTDVDDLQTRLAASGALAVLTDSPTACASLLSGRGLPSTTSTHGTPHTRSVWDRVADLFAPGGEVPQLDENGAVMEVISSKPQPPNAELVHRGVFVGLNLLTYVDSNGTSEEKKTQVSKAARLGEALRKVVQDGKRGGDAYGVVEPAEEAARILRKWA